MNMAILARQRAPQLRKLLALDAVFELIAGLALIAGREQIARWLGVETMAVLAAGGVFLLAAVAVAVVVRRPRGDVVRLVGWANIAGGGLGWLMTFLAWGEFEPAGRALLGAGSDVFIALGVLELLALRQQPESR